MYSIKISTISSNSKKTGELRNRIVFPILPIFKKGKFRWFKMVEIIERKFIVWYTVTNMINGEIINTTSKSKWKIESIVD